MATSQMIRTEEKSGTWASMFPVEQVTEQQSALFAKKLLAVAISNLTYLRAIFPERAYGDRCLGDLNLKILRDDSACPGASQVIKWVKGCFDALDKKYLRMLLIGIYVDPEEPNSVIESYTFKFSYSDQCGVDIYRNGKKITSAHNTEQTKKETIQMLRTIIVLTQSLQPLPDNVMMTMKILYYDEVTPANYEPPGFKASDIDTFLFEEDPVNIKLGDVSTPFHSLKVRIKTDKKQFEFKDDETGYSAVGQAISNSGLDNEQESQRDVVTEKAVDSKEDQPAVREEANVPLTSPDKPESCKVTTPNTPKQDEFKVRCPCGCNEDDGLMIVCDICSLWQHAVCFCILDEEHAPEEHVCDTCAKENKQQKATDPYLSGLSELAAQATCLWRRTLAAVLEFSRLLPHQLANRLGVDTNVAQGLIKRLEKEGFLIAPNKGKRLGKVVVKDKLQREGIPAYFKLATSAVVHSNQSEPSQEVAMDTGEHNTEVASQAIDTQQESKENAQGSDVNTKLTEVTEKAANISIQSHQLRSSSARRQKSSLSVLKTKNNNVQKTESEQKTDKAQKGVVTGSKDPTNNRRGKKRAFSKTDQTEFEISNSQEQSTMRSTRRRKCSDVHKAIVV